MGLFDTTVTNVYTSTARIFKDADLPDRLGDALVSAILAGNSIPDALMVASRNGGYQALERMYALASSSYYYGLPIVNAGALATPDFSTQLASILGTDVGVISAYAKLEPATGVTATEFDANLAMYQHVLANPSVDWDNGKNIRTIDGDTYNTNLSGTYYELVLQNPPLTNLNGKVVYGNVNSTRSVTQHAFEYSVIQEFPQPDDVDGFPVASIYRTMIHYYLYTEGTGQPLLDNFQPTPLTETVYPVVPLRINKQSINTIGGTPYSDVRRILKALPLDVDELVTSIEENPDINDIDDVFISWATHINEQAPWAIEALMGGFKIMDRQAVYVVAPTQSGLLTPNSVDPPMNTFTIEEQDYTNTIEYVYMTTQTLSGSPGYTNVRANGSLVQVLPAIVDTSGYVLRSATTYYDSTITLTRPLTSTTYEKIVVHGLRSKHTIQSREVKFTVQNSNDEGIIIPLFRDVLRDAPSKMRDDMVYGSTHMIAYAVIETKVKWYQTSFFLFLIKGVALVFSVYSVGTALAGLSALSGTALAIEVAKMGLSGIVLDQVTQYLIENGGVFLAILAAVYLSSFNSGGLSSIIDNFADNIFKLLSTVVKVISTSNKMELDNLLTKADAFQDEYDQRMEMIKDYGDALDSGRSNIDWWGSRRTLPNIDSNESPSDFYYRTKTIIDLPAITNGLVHSYHFAQLQLPKADPYGNDFGLTKSDPYE